MKYLCQKVRKMINYRAHSEEQRLNSQIQNCFVRAMQMRSIDELELLLHDQGDFLGKSKNDFLVYLIELSSKQLHLKFIHQINYGVSVNDFPGTEVLEFRYVSLNYLNSTDVMETHFGSKAFPDEVIFHYALLFDKGKISRIFTPKEINPFENYRIYGLNISAN